MRIGALVLAALTSGCSLLGWDEFPCDPGYVGAAGDCVDIDECSMNDRCALTHPRGADENRCVNSIGGYSCICGPTFETVGTDEPSCVPVDPVLMSLTTSAGTLAPSFDAQTSNYEITGLSDEWEISLTANFHERVEVWIDGDEVVSGVPHVVRVDDQPRSVTITVMAAHLLGSYEVVVGPRRATTFVKASNTGSNDLFGAVLALSADGSTLAVGAPEEDSDAVGIDGDDANNNSTNSGAVYVYRRTGTQWAFEAYIKASNSDSPDEFGSSVALSADGSVLAVGALFEKSAARVINGDETNDTLDTAGAVYVFRRLDGAWVQEAYVKPSNTEAQMTFGWSVALSYDGATLAIGAPRESSATRGINGPQTPGGALRSGAVYVIVHDTTGWTQQAYIKASNCESEDWFGEQIALSADGSTLAVGAPLEDARGIEGTHADDTRDDTGAVYMFRRSDTAWAQVAYFNASGARVDDELGAGALALSADGSVLAAGASNIGQAGADTGRVYVFRYVDSTWVEMGWVEAPAGEPDDFFGVAVALNGDGSWLAVGARHESSDATALGGDPLNNFSFESGAAYLFRTDASGWTLVQYVKPPNPSPQDFFGTEVALSADGATLAVSSPYNDSGSLGVDGTSSIDVFDSGAVHIY